MDVPRLTVTSLKSNHENMAINNGYDISISPDSVALPLVIESTIRIFPILKQIIIRTIYKMVFFEENNKAGKSAV